MVNQQLVDFIKKEKVSGQTDEQIRSLLVKSGWPEEDIKDNLSMANNTSPQTQVLPVQPPAQPTQTQQVKTEAIYKQPSHKILKLIIILFFIFVISGAGYFIAGQYINLPWNPFRPNPELVILKALDNLKNIKSQNFESKLSLSSQDVKTNGIGGTFNIDINSSGGVDSANQLADINTSITASATDDTTSKYNISIAGEGRLIQKDFYFQLSDINLGGLESLIMMFGGPDPSFIKNQWIKFNLDQSGQKEITQQIQTISGQKTQIDQNFKDFLDKITKTLLIDKKVYDINQLSDEELSGVRSYHYSVSINRKKLIDASPDIFSAFLDFYKKSSPNSQISSDMTLENFQKGINDFFDKFGPLSIDLYIGKSDNFFHRIQFKKNLDISKINNQAVGSLQISYLIDQTSINTPIQVSTPENSKSIDEIVSPFVEKTQIKNNLSEIRSNAENIFVKNKSYFSLCKNGAINTLIPGSGEALKNINSQGVKNLPCFSSATNYCISAQLKDGTWLCVDSKNFSGTTKCLSSRTVCK
jgi:hypothetical protein